MELHRLQEATVDSIDQINLLMVFHMRVNAQCSAYLVLHELPSKHFETNNAFVEVLLDSLIQVTTNGVVTISLENSGRLTLRQLSLVDTVPEAVPDIHHVIIAV